jgi:hypothetical protein
MKIIVLFRIQQEKVLCVDVCIFVVNWRSEMKEEGQSTVCTKYLNFTHSWRCLYDCRLFAWHCTALVCLLYLWYRVVWHLLTGGSGKWNGLSEECCELSDKYCHFILLNIFMYTRLSENYLNANGQSRSGGQAPCHPNQTAEPNLMLKWCHHFSVT